MQASDQLPADVDALLAKGGGVFRVADAVSAGISSDRIRRLAKERLLTELARGCYAATSRIAGLDGWPRHREMARAYALSCDSVVYVTGWAAAYEWNLRVAGPVPRLPTVLRPGRGGGSSQSRHARVTVGALPPDHQFGVGKRGARRRWGIVSRAWAVGDIARLAPVPDALIVADSALQAGADLKAVAELFRSWRGASRARWVVSQADGLSESPIETLGRFTCIEFDLPLPVSNAWVGADRPEFRVDHLWPYHWAVGEADGAVKYEERAAEVVRKQNDRQFRLHRLGFDVVRYGWDEAAHDRRRLAGKFSALLRDNPPRDNPVRWWKHVPGEDAVPPGPEDWPLPGSAKLILPAAWDVEHDPLRQPLIDLDEW